MANLYAPLTTIGMDTLRNDMQTAEQKVVDLMKERTTPGAHLETAFLKYRELLQQLLFADFEKSERYDVRLWEKHCDGKKFFERALRNLRNAPTPVPVETRQTAKAYLDFLHHSARFYREHIYKLSAAAGGFPELENIAQLLHKKGKEFQSDDSRDSSQTTIPSSMVPLVLGSARRALVHAGDLWRWRANARLEKKDADFGPAIGYYGLAATLEPWCGLAHHQQAIVALAQRNHLRAIYHLHWSIHVKDSHPLGLQNLKLEFEKVNSDWEKGELIVKGLPGDRNGARNALLGWFVRLHCVCFTGQLNGYDQLEREVLTQMINVVNQCGAQPIDLEKRRDISGTLTRMILVNVGAQKTARDRYQEEGEGNIAVHDALLHTFRFNIKTFAALLKVFYDDLRAQLVSLNDNDAQMPTKLTPIITFLLPILRIYNNWLLQLETLKMAELLSDADITQDALREFWPIYARTADLLIQAFPVWDLDDVETVKYMFEEDVDTLSFLPLLCDKTRKAWFRSNGKPKKRFSDRDVVRHSIEEEAFFKIKDYLSDAVSITVDEPGLPMKLLGTRLYCGDASSIEPVVVKPIEPAPIAPPAQPPVATYAVAAASNHTGYVFESRKTRGETYTQSTEAQLTRMVDDLVDDEPAYAPARAQPMPNLPNLPQAPADGSRNPRDSATDLPKAHGFLDQSWRFANNPPARPQGILTPPTARPTPFGGSALPEYDIQRLWDDAPAGPSTPSRAPSFSSHLPTGTLASPPTFAARAHSRVPSATSTRSGSSLTVPESWPLPREASPGQQSSLARSPASPALLFGASPSLWSTTSRRASGFASPQNRQGG